jgi:ubiquinone/menaquinone biosynthesis C-methylase UbiE
MVEKFGDYTGLANSYEKYRPEYSKTIRELIISFTQKSASSLDIADVGAGTGKWTRMLANLSPRSLVAVEPNDDMRIVGSNHSKNHSIEWIKGSAEKTSLADNSVDLVSMASSFHWADFEKATKEFYRILKPGGVFVALWNPRIIKGNRELEDVESKLIELCPTLKRRSSGSSGMTQTLYDDLAYSSYFLEPVYLESKHSKRFSVDEYIGAWRSVNDVQVQLGKEKFEIFIDYIRNKFHASEGLDAQYLTRAWMVTKK